NEHRLHREINCKKSKNTGDNEPLSNRAYGHVRKQDCISLAEFKIPEFFRSPFPDMKWDFKSCVEKILRIDSDFRREQSIPSLYQQPGAFFGQPAGAVNAQV